jgi:hypothetical protein
MSEQWLTFQEALATVRTHIAGSIGRSEAVLKAARASGEVRFRNPADPVLLMADDGIVGMSMRPGALEKTGVTSDGKVITHQMTTNERNRISREDLLEWLNREHPAKPTGAPRGRRPAFDWNAIRNATFKLMDHHGEFSIDDPTWNAQARLEEALNDEFNVGISTLRGRLPKLLDDWRKTKVGN